MERSFPASWYYLARALLSIIMAMLASNATVMGQSIGIGCKVFDPELQSNHIGGCSNGFAEGIGEATGVAYFKGSFKAGRKHGVGIKTWPSSGDRYEGEFVDDLKDGTGVYIWGPRSPWAGEKYTGSYLKDLRQGYGAYEWPTGDRYIGPWAQDVATGPATHSMTARARGQMEALAAVGKPGIKVCRLMTVGIGTRDWIRGLVLGVVADTITIRIDDAGQFGHVILNRPVTTGSVLLDAAQYWMPC